MARHIVAAGHIPMMSVNFGESVDYGHYNMYKREDNEVNEWIA
jgi:hypothetical protein